MNQVQGIVKWEQGGAVATIEGKEFFFSEAKMAVTNQCVVKDASENRIGYSTRTQSFLKGITETFFIGEAASGVVLKRGMVSTKVTWKGETKLLAFGIDAEPYSDPEPDPDSEEEEGAGEEAKEVPSETRYFQIGSILLEHTDHTSELDISGNNAEELIIAGFLAFRILAKSYEGTHAAV